MKTRLIAAFFVLGALGSLTMVHSNDGSAPNGCACFQPQGDEAPRPTQTVPPQEAPPPEQ
ncbi:MAG: hypothetical protein HY078_13165 [Elusimicrobia bacterium]|nr:hypothetical protein [Elusimicrobiota bacterium]